MTETNFDLKKWLLDVDVRRVDESLDEEAKRLFILNDALLNPDSGPVLAALIVTAEPVCGLDALTQLADCSEPRLAMIAIVNVLNILTSENLHEFTVPDSTSSPANEPNVSISKDYFPSESFVRSKVAQAAKEMSKLFIDKVAAGDFCADFLTFLLTALMDLSVQPEGKGLGEEEKDLMSIPTEQFLKTILRTWKTPELYQHCSQTEDDNPSSLGFLVACYMRSLCTIQTNPGDTNTEADTENESRQLTGILALIHMGSWAVKFFLMRFYSPSATPMEQAQLIFVMKHCAMGSEAFTDTLIREAVLTAIARSGENDDSHLQENGTMTLEENVARMRTVMPSILLAIHISSHLLPGDVVPGSGIWFEGKQSRVTIWLSKALKTTVERGMRMVIQSDFPTSEEGHVQNNAVGALSAVSYLILQVWRAGVAVLFRTYCESQRPLRQTVLELFEFLGSAVEDFCVQRSLSWEEVSQSHKMATMQVGLNACNALKRNAEAWKMMTANEETMFPLCGLRNELCEWCLRPRDTALMACGQCKLVSYCCIEHQRAHWAQGHKVECRFFRNCLEGSSFSYGVQGKLCGLIREGDGDTDFDDGTPFGGFLLAQRKELHVLGYRMPGVMFEKRGLDGTSDVFYMTKLATLKTIAGHPDSDKTHINLLIAESLMSASCETPSMLHMRRAGDRDGVRKLALHSATNVYSQSLSVRLL